MIRPKSQLIFKVTPESLSRHQHSSLIIGLGFEESNSEYLWISHITECIYIISKCWFPLEAAYNIHFPLISVMQCSFPLCTLNLFTLHSTHTHTHTKINKLKKHTIWHISLMQITISANVYIVAFKPVHACKCSDVSFVNLAEWVDNSMVLIIKS